MPAPVCTPENSTNVRRVVGLALAVWGLGVVAGWNDGVFAKLSDVELAALALFAFVFASASYFLDRSLRGIELSWRAMGAALATAALVLASSAMFARDVAWLFAGPVTLALCAAALDRALRRRESGNRLRGHLSRARP